MNQSFLIEIKNQQLILPKVIFLVLTMFVQLGKADLNTDFFQEQQTTDASQEARPSHGSGTFASLPYTYSVSPTTRKRSVDSRPFVQSDDGTRRVYLPNDFTWAEYQQATASLNSSSASNSSNASRPPVSAARNGSQPTIHQIAEWANLLPEARSSKSMNAPSEAWLKEQLINAMGNQDAFRFILSNINSSDPDHRHAAQGLLDAHGSADYGRGYLQLETQSGQRIALRFDNTNPAQSLSSVLSAYMSANNLSGNPADLLTMRNSSSDGAPVAFTVGSNGDLVRDQNYIHLPAITPRKWGEKPDEIGLRFNLQ
ncbi:MAG: hypothetical protein HY537_12640 [Deltaproteobacteria bacterium]|nr:hypothetical protein [Deltaproteobacteria bacterium]